MQPETLSEMSGVQLSISSSEVEVLPLAAVPTAVGQPDEPAIGIYVGIEGDGAGYDMRGAILDVAIADIARTGDEALLIKTNLKRSDGQTDTGPVDARLLAIPTPETLDRILARLGTRPKSLRL